MALSKITNSGIGAIDTLAVDTDTLYVDSTNNRVGVGTTSPQATAEISGGLDNRLRINSTDGTTSNNYGIDFSTAGTVRGGIRYNAGNNYLAFYGYDNAERMRLTAAGALLISTTTSGGDGYTFDASGFLTHARASGAAQSMVGFKNGGSFVGEIRTSTTATAYITSSDYRLKENVTATWDATTRLKQLNPVRFNFIADADTTVDGFLAHEVQDVVPEAISGTKDAVDDEGNPEYQGIDQSKLVPLLVKTIQELEARIVALETA